MRILLAEDDPLLGDGLRAGLRQQLAFQYGVVLGDGILVHVQGHGFFHQLAHGVAARLGLCVLGIGEARVFRVGQA